MRKGISPVVATALFLVVAVAAVVGFQAWFQNYSSGIFSDVESQSKELNSDSSTRVEDVIDNDLYLKVDGSFSLNDVRVDDKNCNITKTYNTSGVYTIDLGTCTENLSTSTPNIAVYGDNQVLSKNVYVSGITSNTTTDSGSTSSLDCPSGYVSVPGNSNFNTSDFCVMKYEAKQNSSGVAVSTASKAPWVNINQTDARKECSALGQDYHLITNDEWMTAMRNAEQVPSNWNSSTVGKGFMYAGNNDDNPGYALNASTNDSNGYYRTNDSDTGNCDSSSSNWPSGGPEACEGQRRTLYLSNGDTVWDFPGNVWEWNNDTISKSDSGLGVENSSGWYTSGWYEWTELDSENRSKYGPSNTWNSSEAMGKVYADAGDAYPNGGSTHAFLRSENWDGGDMTGAFTLYLDPGPSLTRSTIGFRCSYAPNH